MTTLTSILNRTIVTTAVIFAGAVAAQADELVSIELVSGKSFTAHVDARTDDEHLWLRFGSGGVLIRRAIEWDSVSKAQHKGQAIDNNELKALATAAEEITSEQISTPPPRTGPSDADRARALLDFGRRVSSVDFDAHLANWDRDVEFDGIALRLFPLDANGRLTKVRGTLEAELVVNRKQDFNDVPRSRGHKARQLGSWTVAINHGDVTEDGVLVKLPFQAAHPEFDTRWASHGLVHVRLIVPGHGVFEHSFDSVRVRPYSPLRDSLERQTGRRFLPTEQTGRGKRSN